MRSVLKDQYPTAPHGRLSQNTGQIWAFVHDMTIGDWALVPFKSKPAVNVAEIVGEYVYNPSGPNPFYHYRNVKWIVQDVPRSAFDEDILLSMGAFSTIFRIQRNNAEKRIHAMKENNWKATTASVVAPGIEDDGGGEPPSESELDLERAGRDQIRKLIDARFKGHGMERLVDALLRAQGYTTYRSPEGPDKGIDILAAPGPLGFGQPRICVQVKSGDSPVDLPTLNQLIGAMQNVHAEQGLLVSWGGFKSSIGKEVAQQFFRVRLWNQDTLIDELLAHYQSLDEDLQAELPLKRIWTVASIEEDESAHG
jgi:restriction system protein